jgi:hypothetical protein
MHMALHFLILFAVLAGSLATPHLTPSCLSQEYGDRVESAFLETLTDAAYDKPNVDREVTDMSDEDYLKLLLTTAGHTEKWVDKNIERVVWMLNCVKPGGVGPSSYGSLSLANVDEATLQRVIDQHREVHDYGQYLREAMRHGKGSTLKYPSRAAAEVLLCFLVRKKYQLEREEEAAVVVEQPDEGINAVNSGDNERKEMEYVREEFEKMGEISGDDVAVDALLKEAAKASRLRVEEMPWKSTKGSEDEEDKAIRNFGFIFTAYRPSCWWFELFEMVRKLMMVGSIMPMQQYVVCRFINDTVTAVPLPLQ